FPVESIAADKIFGEDKLLAANFSQRVQGFGGLGRERESELDRRSGSLMIDDQKIVIVNPGLNRPSTAIYQVVLDGHDRMILLHPNRLCILIAVSGTTIHLLGEFNPVSAARHGSLAGIHNRKVDIRTVGPIVDLLQSPNPDLAERLAGLGR